ncbi:MAG TPA: hypothetical protein ENI73_00110 [Spirochaetes bacterium]|nr:hypothetical protein [Spirochaetota bacterium]
MKRENSLLHEENPSVTFKKSEETILPNKNVTKFSAPVKKRKIVISPLKKDPLNEMSQKVGGEGDFIKTISGRIKTSENCRKCRSLKSTESKEYFCTNFEALWYHRDTRFANFDRCQYFKSKTKAEAFVR